MYIINLPPNSGINSNFSIFDLVVYTDQDVTSNDPFTQDTSLTSDPIPPPPPPFECPLAIFATQPNDIDVIVDV